jgi:formiminotetrahydrofolate cyclodeaminase
MESEKMKTPWMEMTVREFQSALASSSPTPGGGTVAAMSLGQAAALTCMVADLTIGKEKWQSGWDIADKSALLAVRMLTRAGQLAEEDSDSFDAVMASFKLPKENDDEIVTRRTAIHSATLQAAVVPLETARLAHDLLQLLPELAKLGNANAASDVGVAGLLASAACKGALFNVDINLSSIPEEMGAELAKEASDLQDSCRVLSRSVMDEVRARLT